MRSRVDGGHNAQCPMPHAQCPMPNAQSEVIIHLEPLKERLRLVC
ncbi:MAG: hypothetical protein V7K98_28680 [Nostoc sp.]